MKYRAICAALFFALLPAQAFAASRVWISEYGVLTSTNSGGSAGQMAALPALALQSTLDISASAQTSAAFNSATRYIRIVCEVQCAVRGDGGGGAAIQDHPLPVTPGATLVITPGAAGTAGAIAGSGGTGGTTTVTGGLLPFPTQLLGGNGGSPGSCGNGRNGR